MALEKYGSEPENMLQPSACPTPTVHARFSAPRAPFTDAVMSVKTPQPYCRLVWGGSEAMFLHRRSGFIKEPLKSAPSRKDLKSRCVTEETS